MFLCLFLFLLKSVESQPQQTNNIIETTARLSRNRADVAATSSNEIVFFGGGSQGGTTWYDDVDIYNILNGSWNATKLSQPRGYLTSTSVGNVVLFGGGLNSNGSSKVREALWGWRIK
jgi:hypothetical protein